jgi:hypothetical protein
LAADAARVAGTVEAFVVMAHDRDAGSEIGAFLNHLGASRFISMFAGADSRKVVNLSLTQCPYDGALLDAEIGAGGLLLLICAACEAAWETHGSYVGRVREPDRDKLIAARGDVRETDISTHGGR